MMRWLHRRSVRLERMDASLHDSAELREALRHLRRLNRIFGAAGCVRYAVERLWEMAGRPRRFTLLDVGCGSGDVNREILRWADRRGVRVRVLLADVAEEAQREAERLFAGDPRVAFVRQNLFDLSPGSADVVTASQFVHHFSPERVPEAIRRMLDASRLGVVISDIHRHWIPWLAVRIVTRLVSRNRYIRHDGPLSVAKGFRKPELEEAVRTLGIARFECNWRPMFRYAVIIPKERGDEA